MARRTPTVMVRVYPKDLPRLEAYRLWLQAVTMQDKSKADAIAHLLDNQPADDAGKEA